jgi:serine/threonine-protein kinase RsbW
VISESRAELDVTVPASAGYLSCLRALTRRFAEECGAQPDTVDRAVLAVNEACSNVVLHAYGEAEGPLHVRGWRAAESLVLEVSDNGTPVAKPQPGREGGLGLELVRNLSDEVEIEGPGRWGTRLQMSFELKS